MLIKSTIITTCPRIRLSALIERESFSGSWLSNWLMVVKWDLAAGKSVGPFYRFLHKEHSYRASFQVVMVQYRRVSKRGTTLSSLPMIEDYGGSLKFNRCHRLTTSSGILCNTRHYQNYYPHIWSMQSNSSPCLRRQTSPLMKDGNPSANDLSLLQLN